MNRKGDWTNARVFIPEPASNDKPVNEGNELSRFGTFMFDDVLFPFVKYGLYVTGCVALTVVVAAAVPILVALSLLNGSTNANPTNNNKDELEKRIDRLLVNSVKK